ncbi:hypothetical protein LVJ82_13320 [Vitreoscilla massiliensis]|uniref:Uncharacterized protein n=1 Tax=Vitreoscilla massiliensis TaxID=1689272 RepID=A0ABY4E0X0_9NEIS|nr:hypothetical protein [Vitreoscilla massiliensis]UOO88440.1 hypothetical protein LVJ82_13320 [Vitreoscilla massiliensis]
MLFSVWMSAFLLSVGTGWYSSRRFLHASAKRRGVHIVFQVIAGLNYIVCVFSFLLMCAYLMVDIEWLDGVPFVSLLITCIMSLCIASSALSQAESLEAAETPVL